MKVKNYFVLLIFIHIGNLNTELSLDPFYHILSKTGKEVCIFLRVHCDFSYLVFFYQRYFL